MPTPLVDIPMPYGVTVLGDGTNIPKPAARHPKQNGVAGLSLQPGPCRVSVSWEGPEKISVILQNGPNYRTFDTIPEKAGGGLVRECSPSARSQGTMSTLSHRAGLSILASAARSRSILSTRFSSGRGGGVGDRTDFGSGSEAAGRGFGIYADCLSARFSFGLRAVARGRFRFGCHLAGACPGRGRSSARYHLQYGADGDRLCGAEVCGGASRSRTGRLRNTAVGVLSILWGARFKRAVVGAGDSGELDRRGVISAAGGGAK